MATYTLQKRSGFGGALGVGGRSTSVAGGGGSYSVPKWSVDAAYGWERGSLGPEKFRERDYPGPLNAERIAAKRPPESDAEANIRWGAASRFEILRKADQVATDPRSVSVDYPVPPPEEEEEQGEPPQRVTLTFDLTPTSTEEVRVENPDDSEQYVIVQKMLDAAGTMTTSEGATYDIESFRVNW